MTANPHSPVFVSSHTARAVFRWEDAIAALQRAYDDLRQTQQQVMQQERLRALGQMSSGIAHDINNAISPVALYTEALLEREHGLTDRGRKQLEIIQRAVDDVAQTVLPVRQFQAEQLRGLATAGHRARHVAHAEIGVRAHREQSSTIGDAAGLRQSCIDGGEGALEVGHQ